MTKIWLVILVSLSSAWSAETSPEVARRIREALLVIEGSEQEASDAAEKLKAEPRAAVLEVLKDELTSSPEPRSSALRAVAVLETRELWPELKLVTARSDQWRVFATVNRLMTGESSGERRAEIVKIYLSRLESLPAPAKQAVLDGLAAEKTPLARDAFQHALDDGNFQVRIAAVKQFLASRGALSLDEQKARFQIVFAVKPYQARLLAMQGFLKIEKSERAKLTGAIKKDLCAAETRDEVKSVCRDLVKDSGAKP